MKKKIMWLLSILSSCYYLNGQTSYTPLIEEGSTWSVIKTRTDSAGAHQQWSEIFFFGGDTLINGRLYKSLYDTPDSIVDPTSVNKKYRGAIREEDKAVTFVKPGWTTIDTMYDFNLREGDIFRTGIDDVGQPFDLYVKEVDSVETAKGFNRKYLLFSRRELEDTIYESLSYIWVEGVGDIERGILSPNCNIFERNYDCLNILLCHKDNDTLIYKNKAYETCFLSSTSTKPIDQKVFSIKLFPNPFKDEFNIVFPPEYQFKAFVRLTVFDLQGKKVFQKTVYPLPGEVISLNFPFTIPGIYIIKLEDIKCVESIMIIKK